MAETVQILFVKKNGIALLLEGEELEKYLRIYKNALKILTMSKGMVEQQKGKRISFEITPLLGKLTAEEKKSPTDRIIIIQKTAGGKTAFLFEEYNFRQYRDNFFTGKEKSAQKNDYKNIKGENVRVTIA